MDHRLQRTVRHLEVDPDLGPARPAHPLPIGATCALVATGGALGALARGLLEAGAPAGPGWPWATLCINVAGAALLAGLLGFLADTPAGWVVRPLLGAGVLGGFTTFSTFAVEVDGLLRHGRAGLALGYVVASVAGALLAAAGGVLVGRAWSARARVREPEAVTP